MRRPRASGITFGDFTTGSITRYYIGKTGAGEASNLQRPLARVLINVPAVGAVYRRLDRNWQNPRR